MKQLTSVIMASLQRRVPRHNLRLLARYLFVLLLMVTLFSALFHYLMLLEGRRYSWITGFYWTLTVMSTLGFGDITFESDAGRVFSMVVLVAGTLYLLVLLPFTFIQFFFAPWLEAQKAARAPDRLPASMRDHVLLLNYGPVDAALVKRLSNYRYPYAVLCPNLAEALELDELGVRVVRGDLDDPETFRKLRVDQAALVASTRSDPVNTNVAFTVREISATVPIVATASHEASVVILELAGSTRVMQLAELLGQALARRIVGRDAKTHVIGQFDDMLIAEAAAANTPLVGKLLREAGLSENFQISVIGVWERGMFQLAGPETRITSSTVLLLAGTREQLDRYDEFFCIYNVSLQGVIIVGGGRVGRAVAKALDAEGIDYRIIEKQPERVRDPAKYIVGDAANLEVLTSAGIDRAPAVAITTHEDDINVYLTIYCRRLRPDTQIISRATHERNVSTLHRAGADFVLSYASLGANMLFNLLKRTDVLMMAEGLDVFRVKVPDSLAGMTIAQSAIRTKTNCHIIALDDGGQHLVNPTPDTVLNADAEMILIATTDAEERFLNAFVNR